MGIFKIQYRHNQIFITVMAIIELAQSGSNISIPVLTPKWILLKTGIALKLGKDKPIIKLFQFLILKHFIATSIKRLYPAYGSDQKRGQSILVITKNE